MRMQYLGLRVSGHAIRGNDVVHKIAKVALSLLLGVLIAAVSNGQNAVARQPGKPDAHVDKFYADVGDFFRSLLSVKTIPSLMSDARGLWLLHDHAIEGLKENNRRKFDDAHNAIKAFGDGSLEAAPEIRRLANDMLTELPDHFVYNFAYIRPDGSIATEPDAFVRWYDQIHYDVFGGGGGEDGVD